MRESNAQPVLRPLSVTDIMDTAVGLYRHHFGILLGIVAVVWAPLMGLQVVTQAVQAAMTGDLQTGEGPPGALIIGSFFLVGLGWMITWVATIVFAPLAAGAVVRAVSEAYLGGPITVQEAYRLVRPHWAQLIGAQLLVQLLVGAVTAVLAIFIFIFAAAAFAVSPVAGIIALSAAVLMVGAGAFAIFSLLLATVPAIVVENLGIIDALRRSVELVRPYLLHALGAYVLLGLLLLVPILIAYAIGIYFEMLTGFESITTGVIIMSAVVAMATLLIKPVMSIGVVVIYYDLRVRQEGFDLQMMAESLHRPPPPPTARPAPLLAPPAESPRWGPPPSPPPVPRVPPPEEGLPKPPPPPESEY